MRIVEKKISNLDIDLLTQDVDNRLTYWDKKKGRCCPATWIDKSPFLNKNHVILLSGACGSGKTSLGVSLFTSMKQRVYSGLFDKVYICIPSTTFQSLGDDDNNPFSGIPKNQVFHKFDLDFVNEMKEKTDENSLQKLDTLLFIDDGASSLKSNKKLIDAMSDLVMTHRHRRTTICLMCQDLIQIPLAVRENCSSIVYFKPTNQKRTKLFYEEYMSDVMNYAEFIQLCNYIFKKKGDHLHISLTTNPKRYFRNFREIFFKSVLNNNAIEEETEESEKD